MAMPMTISQFPALLHAEGLACRRGERLIFEGLRLNVPEGGALLLLGPNGSGKSSLLRVLAGLLRAHAGSVHWAGRPLADDREAHAGRVHYVGHQDALKTVLTVRENLLFWSRLQDPDVSPARVEAALAAMALAPLADLPVQLLSAGQRRRLALARLLAAEAPLWLLDEPSVGLDLASVGRLEAMLAAHRATGGVVVLSTHVDLDLPDAQILQLDHFVPKFRPIAEMGQEAWL
jgi:heme exporter protein A